MNWLWVTLKNRLRKRTIVRSFHSTKTDFIYIYICFYIIDLSANDSVSRALYCLIHHYVFFSVGQVVFGSMSIVAVIVIKKTLAFHAFINYNFVSLIATLASKCLYVCNFFEQKRIAEELSKKPCADKITWNALCWYLSTQLNPAITK